MATRCNTAHPDAPALHCVLSDEHYGPHEAFNRKRWIESPDYADGGVTAAAVEKETEDTPVSPEGGAAYWRARAEKAERVLGDAEAYALTAQQRAEKAEQFRHLTPDDITSAMVTRAVAANYTPAAREGITGYMHHILTAALTEPQRPEGAEDHEVTIIDTLGAGRLTDDEVATLADALATEENR